MIPLIRLRPSHTAAFTVHHPMLQNLRGYGPEELQKLALAVAEDPSRSDELVLAFRSLLRNLVGRYMYTWRASRRFEDEMVSEGFVALSSLMGEISLDFLAGRDIIKIGSRRIQDTINRYLNRNQSMSAPGMTKQKELIADGGDPIYRVGEDVTVFADTVHPVEDGDEWKRDVLDILSKMEPQDEIDTALLNRSNWGRGHQELADELGVGVGTIHRRKKRLYKQYLKLTR